MATQQMMPRWLLRVIHGRLLNASFSDILILYGWPGSVCIEKEFCRVWPKMKEKSMKAELTPAVESPVAGQRTYSSRRKGDPGDRSHSRPFSGPA